MDVLHTLSVHDKLEHLLTVTKLLCTPQCPVVRMTSSDS